jgi:hypothetical protein
VGQRCASGNCGFNLAEFSIAQLALKPVPFAPFFELGLFRIEFPVLPQPRAAAELASVDSVVLVEFHPLKPDPAEFWVDHFKAVIVGFASGPV